MKPLNHAGAFFFSGIPLPPFLENPATIPCVPRTTTPSKKTQRREQKKAGFQANSSNIHHPTKPNYLIHIILFVVNQLPKTGLHMIVPK